MVEVFAMEVIDFNHEMTIASPIGWVVKLEAPMVQFAGIARARNEG